MSRSPRLAAGRARALGLPTRGTTTPNRLRRMDNWIIHRLGPTLRGTDTPIAVDLGYGHSPITAIELSERLRRVRSDLTTLGIELDPDRVAAAQSAAHDRLRFERGGFEIGGHQVALIRAANVLRQYPETAVAPAWSTMQHQLVDDGAIVEGTSDELGRLASWVLLDRSEPISLTFSVRLSELKRPSDLAARLVKALIHRNHRGEPIHDLLQAMDAAWDRHAALATFGPRQRWTAMAAEVARDWPVLDSPARHRQGELTLAWTAITPSG